MSRTLLPLACSLGLILGCGHGNDARRLGVEPDPQALAYFVDTYEESRALFRAQAEALAARFPEAERGVIPVESATGEDLSVDHLYLPPTGAPQQLLILSCGVHGAEAFATCAVLRRFLDHALPTADRTGVGVLALHGVNPWGHHHGRRVTEHNVDVNRNASEDPALYLTVNEGYRTVHDLLNPDGPVKGRGLRYHLFPVKAVANIARYGMPALRQAALQGQYEFPKGIYYGGAGPEPQLAPIRELLTGVTRGYGAVVMIDLHTGYGERGTLHLFPNPPKNAEVRAATEALFAGHPIDWGDGDDFYTTTGDFVQWVGAVAAEGLTFVPMVFEFGTLDSQTTSGSIESIHRTILENQGAQYGYRRPRDERLVKERYREMFYPSSPHWRAKVMADSDAMWAEVLVNIRALGAEHAGTPPPAAERWTGRISAAVGLGDDTGAPSHEVIRDEAAWQGFVAQIPTHEITPTQPAPPSTDPLLTMTGIDWSRKMVIVVRRGDTMYVAPEIGAVGLREGRLEVTYGLPPLGETALYAAQQGIGTYAAVLVDRWDGAIDFVEAGVNAR